MIARLDLAVVNVGSVHTFRRGSTGSVVDITLASRGVAARVTGWRVLEELTLSDHQYIEFRIEEQPAPRAHPRAAKADCKGWQAGKLDSDRMKSFLEAAKLTGDQENKVEVNRVADLVEYAVDTITAACDVSMPRRKTNPRNRVPVYWWTSEIADLRRKCLRARRKCQRARPREGDLTLENGYKEARKTLRAAIKSSKRKCWKDLCRSVDDDPWGLPYRIVTKKLGGGKPIPGLSCPERVRNIVETLFPTHEQRSRFAGQYDDGDDDEQAEPFNIDELTRAQKRLEPGKAPGLDNIPNEALKIVVDVWPELLLQTYNNCLASGFFPARWKKQKLVLLRKGDKPLDEPSSYRPLSLLDTMGKLLERLILQRLEAHIEDVGGLSPRQFGFRKGRSTTDAIITVTNLASQVKKGPLRSKGYCALVALDVRNAFNRARWKDILEALEARGIPKYLLRMIDSYFGERILVFSTENGQEKYIISAGVPQGSVLGPFLWNVMYDGLLNLKLPRNSYIVGFADDAGVVITARTTEILELTTNVSLRMISRWMGEHGLELAVHKTEAILITDRRVFTPPTIWLEGQVVPWSESLKYLGVHLDSGLRFATHIMKAAEKASVTVAALARLMPNIAGPNEMKRRLLNSVVHSKILYGAEVWADAMDRAGARRRLAVVQRRSALRVISAYRTVSEEAALLIASIPPIDLLVRERREVYDELKQNQEAGKPEIKRRARQRLLDRWQERWDSDTSGRWTHHLIRNVAAWYGRGHGHVGFYLTQVLSGHGCFNQYLKRFQKIDSEACTECGDMCDDARHSIFQCPATQEDRTTLLMELRIDFINEDNIVPVMLTSGEAWAAVAAFATSAMKKRRTAEERARKARATAV